MNQQTREWYNVFVEDAAKPKATANGKDLLTAIQKELIGLRHMIVKRTNKMLLEAAITAKSLDEVRALTVQTLVNISDREHPLYDRNTNRLSQDAMRLFYNMPATVLCCFDMSNSALRDLQCNPEADKPLTKKEFLLWKLTDKDGETGEEDRVAYFNRQLKNYGYTTLDKDNPMERLVISLLTQEEQFDKQTEHKQNARRTICRILHAENEMAVDRIGDIVH